MPAGSLRIALFSDSALPILNGVSVSIDALVRELREQGHSVHLFTSAFPGHRNSDPNTHRFPAIRTPIAPDYPLAVPPFYPVLRHFRRQQFDVIHSHTPFTIGFVGLRWAQSHELPIVATYHTHYDKYAHYIPFLNKRYIRYKIAKHTNFYYNSVDQVITPSEASERWLQRHSVKTPITVIPTGVPKPQMIDRSEARRALGIAPNRRVLLYTGRIAKEKNLGIVLEAAALAFKSDPTLVLWLVGDGPAREFYTHLARDLGIGDRVKFVGFVPRPEVDRYYAAADLFVFASMTETQGLVVTEAMTYGLPAVVVQGGGAGDALHDGENGILVRNDAGALADAVSAILASDTLYAKLSEGARFTSRQYTVEAMAERVVGVYHAAIGSPKSRGETAVVL